MATGSTTYADYTAPSRALVGLVHPFPVWTSQALPKGGPMGTPGLETFTSGCSLVERLTTLTWCMSARRTSGKK